ncbi:MAG: IS630 family transposase, partial [Allgaiera sp.]|nr:IS630 family transposase [Allgaiera sp.]
MGKPYSLDLRERICAYVSRGHSARAAGRVFAVSAATAVRFVAEHRARGTVVAKRQGRPPGRFGKLAPHLDFLLDIVRAEPDITLKELAAALSDTEGVQVQLSSLHRALERAGLSYEKGLIAADRDRPTLRQARREWITRRQPRMRQDPHRPVFTDETAVKTNLTRLRGPAPVAERLYGAAPFGKWAPQTFIAGLTQNALIAPWVITGAMNGPAFDACIETQLAPLLDPGTVVIRDNLSTHRSPRAAEALQRQGCRVLVLPPYSPDLNPIEMAFSKLKAHLRRIGARTFDALFEALGDICDLFEPQECWNF